MTRRFFQGFFEDIHFTESTLGHPRVDGADLIIEAAGLSFVGNHPLSGSSDQRGKLIFEGVTESRRSVSEYIGDPKNPIGLMPERTEIDGPFPIRPGVVVAEFRFEGLMEGPYAWVGEWVIHAEKFRLELEEDNADAPLR